MFVVFLIRHKSLYSHEIISLLILNGSYSIGQSLRFKLIPIINVIAPEIVHLDDNIILIAPHIIYLHPFIECSNLVRSNIDY